MNKVAILRAIGDGGLQDPGTGQYISSKRDTLIPYTAWAESLANHGKVKVIEILENSNWSDYVNQLAEAQGDEDKALAAYRKSLPTGAKAVERMRTVKDAADLERQQKEEKGGEAPVAKTAAPTAAPKGEGKAAE